MIFIIFCSNASHSFPTAQLAILFHGNDLFNVNRKSSDRTVLFAFIFLGNKIRTI